MEILIGVMIVGLMLMLSGSVMFLVHKLYTQEQKLDTAQKTLLEMQNFLVEFADHALNNPMGVHTGSSPMSTDDLKNFFDVQDEEEDDE